MAPRRRTAGRLCRSTDPRLKPRKPQPLDNPLNPQLFHLISSASTATLSFLRRFDLHLQPQQSLALESLLASLSLSLSSLPLPQPPPPNPLTPSFCWFHRFLCAATYDDDPRWIRFFRMSKPSFSLLLRLLAPSLHHSLPFLSPLYTLASSLFRLAHSAPYKSVARRFSLHSSSEACRAFLVFCKVVNEKLGHLFEFHSDTRRIVAGFGWISLPNCSGVLGMEKFGIEGDSLGENGYVLAQALVDSEGRFVDVSAGWPGTMRPASILRETKLFSSVEESKEVLNGPLYQLSEGNFLPQYIVGEACFPLLPWLLTPFYTPCTSLQRVFNSSHRRAMGLVRTAFRRIRARWKLLERRWKEESVEILPFVIVATCLLHNFLIKCGESLSDENAGSPKEEELPVFDGDLNEIGERVRDTLALHLSQVSDFDQMMMLARPALTAFSVGP